MSGRLDRRRLKILWRRVKLGEASDTVIAKRLGVASTTVAKKRRSLGISRFPVKNLVLEEIVKEILSKHYYPILTCSLHKEVIEEYGQISKRQIQRVLARLRKEKS